MDAAPLTATDGDMGHMDHGNMDHGQMDHSMHHNHAQMDHGHMDHSKMGHGQMDHSQMNHGQMDHSKMNHGQMDHEQMDHDPMDPARMDGGAAAMDHSSHHQMSSGGGMGHSMDMMKMYFHGGYTEVILFDFWRINSVGGLIGSMFAVFAMAVIYEAIKFYKETVFRRHLVQAATNRVNRYDNVSPNPTSGGGSNSNLSRSSPQPGNSLDDIETRQDSPAVSTRHIRTMETSMWSIGHLIMTLLNGLQIAVAYLLMLIVMTYNTYLCLAVVLGFSFGYFLFGWRRNVVLEEDEHCH